MLSTIRDIKRRPAASVTEPVTRAEAKQWCIIDHTNDDTLIDSLITVARVQIENKTRLSLVEWDIVLTVDIHGGFRFPWGPVRTVTTIERRDGYTDDDPDWYPLTDEDYRINGEDEKTINGIRCATYKVTYVAGFTDDAGDYPVRDNLKKAILAQVAFLYENRGDNNSKEKFSEVARALLAASIDYSHV
jgi:uncharacterized phiE125 gp8 family phage protein